MNFNIGKWGNILRLFIVLGALFLAIGCSDESNSPKFVAPPKLVHAGSIPVALSAIVEFRADQAVVASYTITDGTHTWQGDSRDAVLLGRPSGASYTETHRDAVLKFRPNTQHRIQVRITNSKGQSTEFSEPLTFTTKALPENFPRIRVDGEGNFGADPVMALLSLASHHPNTPSDDGQTQPGGWLVGLDNTAGVVWYMQADYHWNTIKQLESGNLRLYSDLGHSIEVDMLGRKVRGWAAPNDLAGRMYFRKHGIPAIPLSVDGIHHRAVTVPNGNSLVLSYELEYQTTRIDGTQQAFVGDIISELDSVGNVVKEWRLGDLLDNTRAGFETAESAALTLYAARYSSSPQVQWVDWSSASGLAYDKSRDTIVVALRNQRALAGLGRTSGELKWLLSAPAGWGHSHASKVLYPSSGQSSDSDDWPDMFGQPYIAPDGQLLVLDSRGLGSASRVVRYSINEKDQRFSQTTSHSLADERPSKMIYTSEERRVLIIADASGLLPSATLSSLPYAQIVNNKPLDAKHSELLVTLANHALLDAILIDRSLPPEPPAASASGRDIPPVNQSANDVASAVALVPATITGVLEQVPVTEGDWRILIGAPGEQTARTLSIDQQRGQVAVGHLEDYPVIIVIKDRGLSFTYRTTGVEGTASFKFNGNISDNGYEAEGLLDIRDAGGQILAADVPWSGVKK